MGISGAEANVVFAIILDQLFSRRQLPKFRVFIPSTDNDGFVEGVSIKEFGETEIVGSAAFDIAKTLVRR